jgi:pimeloyl-ACP methyl ester carboxylesterase
LEPTNVPKVKEKTEVGRVNAAVEEHNFEIDGLPIRYLAAGEGPPLVLLHGAGDNALDWRWVIPDLAATHRVYAPDLPGSSDSARPAAAYSPAFFERFAAGFLEALGIGRATFVGNSLGGLIALRLALSEPARVTALVLVDSAGLGSAVNPAFTSVNIPLLGEAAMPFWRATPSAPTPSGRRPREFFTHPPRSVPREWLAEQCRLARSPGYLEAHLTTLRALVGPFGQREVMVDRLGILETPTLVVWGERDRVFPPRPSGRSPPPGRIARPHLRLRPHAPRRVPRSLSESPRRVPPQAGAPLIGGDPKKAQGYVGNVQEQGSRGKPFASAG